MGKQYYDGAPTIVIEILSPSTAFRDLNQKLWLYQKHNVKEYWIVDPKVNTITIHNFENDTVKSYGKDELLTSDVFTKMKIDLQEVFTD